MVGVQAGFKFIEFQAHPQQDYDDIYAFMDSLRPEKSPHLVDGKLTPDAVQGKAIFESQAADCLRCHKPDHYYGDSGKYDVGTRHEADWTANDISGYVSPPLHELWRSAPYLHDGSAATIQEVLTTHNPSDQHGRTSHLTRNEIDQLAAYILQLDGEAPASTGQPWTLTVTNGDGSGSYLEGSTITLTAAAPPPGQAFYRWTGTGIANPESPTATLIMPGENTTVSATYLANGGWIGFDTDDSLWSSPDNWTGQKVPVPGVDQLVFAGTRRLNALNDLPVGSGFPGLHFLTTAGPFLLGGNGLGLDGDVVSDSPSPQTINLPMVLSGTRTFAALGGEIVVGKPLGGPGGLIKTGGGALTLAAPCTYAGPTEVREGILLVESDNSAAPGDVSILSGAVLSGNGTLGGQVTVAGLLSPASTGPAATLRLWTGGTLQTGATTALRVLTAGGNGDRIAVEGGTLTFGGTLAVSFSEPVANGTSFPLFTRTGGSFAGSFASVTTSGLAPYQHATFDATTGLLTVRSAFHDWLAAHNITDTDPFADTDGDQVGNLVEFGLLGNPGESDVSRTGTQARQGRNGDLLITFNRRTDDPTLRITVEKTEDLLAGSWTETGIEVLGTPEDILENGTKVGERVTCRIQPFAPSSGPPRIFARLRIHW